MYIIPNILLLHSFLTPAKLRFTSSRNDNAVVISDRRALSTLKIDRRHKINMSDQCPISLEPLQPDARTLGCCKARYNIGPLHEYLRRGGNACPTCRRTISNSDIELGSVTTTTSVAAPGRRLAPGRRRLQADPRYARLYKVSQQYELFSQLSCFGFVVCLIIAIVTCAITIDSLEYVRFKMAYYPGQYIPIQHTQEDALLSQSLNITECPQLLSSNFSTPVVNLDVLLSMSCPTFYIEICNPTEQLATTTLSYDHVAFGVDSLPLESMQKYVLDGSITVQPYSCHKTPNYVIDYVTDVNRAGTEGRSYYKRRTVGRTLHLKMTSTSEGMYVNVVSPVCSTVDTLCVVMDENSQTTAASFNTAAVWTSSQFTHYQFIAMIMSCICLPLAIILAIYSCKYNMSGWGYLPREYHDDLTTLFGEYNSLVTSGHPADQIQAYGIPFRLEVFYTHQIFSGYPPDPSAFEALRASQT